MTWPFIIINFCNTLLFGRLLDSPLILWRKVAWTRLGKLSSKSTNLSLIPNTQTVARFVASTSFVDGIMQMVSYNNPIKLNDGLGVRKSPIGARRLRASAHHFWAWPRVIIHPQSLFVETSEIKVSVPPYTRRTFSQNVPPYCFTFKRKLKTSRFFSFGGKLSFKTSTWEDNH